jgi:AcrR family transcriptional regulator
MVSEASALDTTAPALGAKERILHAAYELFSQHGIGAVGIDTIIARSGVAKMSLYRHFRSKEELVLAFLNKREMLWTREWLETEMLATDPTPTGRLLAIFDIFDGWFQKADFEGCSFINVLLESAPNSSAHRSATEHLAKIRAIIAGQAREARLCDPEKFAQMWHFLMKGCIVSAHEGNHDAAKHAKEAGTILLEHWPRV